MKTPLLTRKRLPLLILFICSIEVLVYVWSDWTSTLDRQNFFAIESAYVFDKSARIAGRISTALLLIILFMLAYAGLRKMYADDAKREAFRVLITLFAFNHLIHLLFVVLLLRNYGKSLTLDVPIQIGGPLHGCITYITIVLMPLLLWNSKGLNKLLYVSTILYVLNVSGFIIKTFLSKVNPPVHPAYHNQFGVFVLSAACLYLLYSVYTENTQSAITQNEPEKGNKT